jgi:hypothetical protein
VKFYNTEPCQKGPFLQNEITLANTIKLFWQIDYFDQSACLFVTEGHFNPSLIFKDNEPNSPHL